MDSFGKINNLIIVETNKLHNYIEGVFWDLNTVVPENRTLVGESGSMYEVNYVMHTVSITVRIPESDLTLFERDLHTLYEFSLIHFKKYGQHFLAFMKTCPIKIVFYSPMNNIPNFNFNTTHITGIFGEKFDIPMYECSFNVVLNDLGNFVKLPEVSVQNTIPGQTHNANILGQPQNANILGQSGPFWSAHQAHPNVFSAVAQPNTNIFGQPNTTQPNIFDKAQQPPNTTQPNIFGQPNTTQPNIFDKAQQPQNTTQPNIFGQPQPQNTTQPNIFGQPQPQNTTQPNIFGQPPNTTQPNIFGQPQPNTTQPNIFGQPQQNTTQPNIFGQPQQNTTQPNIFGQSQQNTTQPNIFGQPQQNTTQPNIFGQPPQNTNLYGQQSRIFGQTTDYKNLFSPLQKSVTKK